MAEGVVDKDNPSFRSLGYPPIKAYQQALSVEIWNNCEVSSTTVHHDVDAIGNHCECDMQSKLDMVPIRVIRRGLEISTSKTDDPVPILMSRSLLWRDFLRIYLNDPSREDEYFIKGQSQEEIPLWSTVESYIAKYSKLKLHTVFVYNRHEIPTQPGCERCSILSRRKIRPKSSNLLKIVSPVEKNYRRDLENISPKVTPHAGTIRAPVVASVPNNMTPVSCGGTLDKALSISDQWRNLKNLNSKDFNIKTPLLKFAHQKVSNKDMLKVREELLKLKEEMNYFRFTSIAPLTAGLLDQMLCGNFQ